MTVTMNPPENVGGNSWRFSWSSDQDDPTFYVYDLSEGGLLDTTKGTSITITLEPGESRVLEVTEEELAAVPRGYPSRLLLYWYGPAGTSYYKVEEYVGAAWVTRARIYDRGQGHFTWRTRPLEDVTTHQFRIVPVGTNGNEGTPVTWSALMVTHPAPPEVDYAYSSGTGKVTVSAA